jgi:hypothetical protein
LPVFISKLLPWYLHNNFSTNKTIISNYADNNLAIKNLFPSLATHQLHRLTSTILHYLRSSQMWSMNNSLEFCIYAVQKCLSLNISCGRQIVCLIPDVYWP